MENGTGKDDPRERAFDEKFGEGAKKEIKFTRNRKVGTVFAVRI